MGAVTTWTVALEVSPQAAHLRTNTQKKLRGFLGGRINRNPMYIITQHSWTLDNHPRASYLLIYPVPQGKYTWQYILLLPYNFSSSLLLILQKVSYTWVKFHKCCVCPNSARKSGSNTPAEQWSISLKSWKIYIYVFFIFNNLPTAKNLRCNLHVLIAQRKCEDKMMVWPSSLKKIK